MLLRSRLHSSETTVLTPLLMLPNTLMRRAMGEGHTTAAPFTMDTTCRYVTKICRPAGRPAKCLWMCPWMI